MPQMSPLMWMFLMAVVVMIYELFVVVNYFILESRKEEKNSFGLQVNLKNWRW